MKKMLVIIFILLIIFIGIYINKKNIGNETVTATEVNNIEQYISKIYMWQEVTEEALPKFNNINDAPDLWLWEVVKKNLDNYEVSYDEVKQKAKEIFGEEFTKQFPKEGTEYIQYDKELQKYIATGIGLDTLEDTFLIKNINKTKNGYDVEIIEYLEDYENAVGLEDENSTYDVYIKNLNKDIIATVKSDDSETNVIEVVKENIEKFTTKTVKLVKDSEGKIFVESVK